ncbi:MAG: hypothetical protein E7019_02670 [Alphaproteobacteria bacterium]|nr:hypothetical protein [Alphaproteobacteria bacterium]
MRNKFLAASAMLILSACAHGEDSTLQDILFEDPYDQEFIKIGTHEEQPVKKAEHIEYVAEDRKETIIYEPATYQLPTREERYANYTPTAEIYAIPATRATNKMLDETREFYEQNGDVFLFIASLKKADRKLPDGVYKAEQVTKKIIEGSDTFKVVGDKEEADYILETIIENNGTPEEPILTYRMILSDMENNKINEWSETVRRLQNDDRSWW